jgi:hypothetical protein
MESLPAMNSPIRAPCTQFKPSRSITFAWHRILDCGVVEIKCPIPLRVLQRGINIASLQQKDAMERRQIKNCNTKCDGRQRAQLQYSHHTRRGATPSNDSPRLANSRRSQGERGAGAHILLRVLQTPHTPDGVLCGLASRAHLHQL